MLLSGAASSSYSQVSIRDSAINLHMFSAQYSMLWSGADMADRFGKANNLGLTYAYKFRNNFFIELTYNYMWGNEVNEGSILDHLKTTSGNIIDNQGYLNPAAFELKGFSSFLGIGKIFPVIGPNPNSGLFLSLHGGFLQHQIDFSYLAKNIPQVQGDYAKGYDRLSNGFAIKENIGYMNLSNNNFLNWTVGLEFMQAFTQSRRDWNIDTRQKDTKKRIDLLSGFYIQIRIPLYKKAPETFYYN
jgi:hypothetical protein